MVSYVGSVFGNIKRRQRWVDNDEQLEPQQGRAPLVEGRRLRLVGLRRCRALRAAATQRNSHRRRVAMPGESFADQDGMDRWLNKFLESKPKALRTAGVRSLPEKWRRAREHNGYYFVSECVSSY